MLIINQKGRASNLKNRNKWGKAVKKCSWPISFSDSTNSTGLAAVKVTALGRPNLLVSPTWESGNSRKERQKDEKNMRTMGLIRLYNTCLYHWDGQFILQMQLSEVIVRARRYYQEVTGKEGFVHEGKVGKEAFEKRFKENEIHEGNDEVQQWLSNMTSDKKGYIDF